MSGRKEVRVLMTIPERLNNKATKRTTNTAKAFWKGLCDEVAA